MTKRMIIMLAIVGLLFGGLFGFKAFLGGVIKKSISAQGVPPQTVSTAKAQFTEWQGEFQAVGTLRAARGADIAPELSGVITAIHFQSGQAVGAGAPLVQLNAESDLARLQSLAAAAELAQANYERDKKQLEFQAVSQAVVETDAATLKSARARETSYAVCYLDLDQFKLINDTCGHSAGDALLGQVGALLKSTVASRPLAGFRVVIQRQRDLRP